MIPAQFTALFPEFEDARPGVVAGRLAMALADMGGPDYTVWPALAQPGAVFTLTDLAQAFKAADLLVQSPFGTELRLKPDPGGVSSYSKEYDKLCLKVAMGGLITAGGGVMPTAAASGTGNLVLEPGNGTASVTNGSFAVTFALAQTLPAGTILVFLSQPGAYYALAANITGASSGVLTAQYTGITNAGTMWNLGPA